MLNHIFNSPKGVEVGLENALMPLSCDAMVYIVFQEYLYFYQASVPFKFNASYLKMVRDTLKILQHLLQNFQSVSPFWDVRY